MKLKNLQKLVYIIALIFFAVNGFSQLNTSTSVTNVTCNGGSNGAVNLTVTGGTTPYHFTWTNGTTTEDLTNLTAGTYTVTVSDSQGPSLTAFNWTYVTTISSHTVLIQANTITINGSAIASGDYIGAFYNMTGGGVGCGGYVQWLGATTSMAAWPDDSQTTTKDGFTEGEAFQWKVWHAISGSTGVVVSMTATYMPLPNQGNFATNGMSGIASMTGTYSQALTTTTSATVNQPTAITATSNITNVTCNGGSNGAIDITPSGGVTPYTYNWSSGATTQDVTNLAQGSYTVTIGYSGICSNTASFTITQPAAMSLSSTQTQVSCFGGTNGAIDLSVSGGATPYTYHWSNNATTQDLNNVASGNYSVTVTDANTCSSSSSLSLGQPTDITVTGTTTNVSCNGGSNGSINTTTSGGTSPYTYLWSNGSTQQNISGLASGTFTVTVTDSHSCLKTASFTINQPTAINITSNITNVSCNGGTNGAIDVSVSGGTSPYTYHWGNNATTQDLNNIASGTFLLTVTDNNSCTSTSSSTVTQPVVLSVTTSASNVSCLGGSNGAIDITPAGGTTPYVYHWNNNATTQDLSNLASGSYTVTITDSHNCILTSSASVTQPSSAVSQTGVVTHVTCNGYLNGSINITVTGGTSPYTFNWSNSTTSEDLSNVAAGSYTVTIHDSHSCILTANYTVNQPTAISITYSTSNYNGYQVSSYGATDGWIDISVSGGNSPYTYVWSTGATTQDISNVSAGTKVVNIFDANSCFATFNIVMNSPSLGAALVATGTSLPTNCNGSSDGSINITVSGGVPPYTYAWTNGATTQDLSSLSAGSYSVTVTDSGVTTPTFNWTSLTAGDNHSILLLPGTVTLNGSAISIGDYLGVFYQIPSGGLGCGGYMVWTGAANALAAWGDDSFTAAKDGFNSGEAFNWKIWVTSQGCSFDMAATYNGAFPNQGAFTVNGMSQVSSLIGSGTCPPPGNSSQVVTVTVNQPAVINPNATVGNVSCSGGSNGTISLAVSGGTSPYVYHWSTGSTANSISGLVTGNYSVTITDNHSCTATASFFVAENPSLNLTATISDYNGYSVSAYGASDGWVNLTIGGGNSPFIFNWSNGATTQNLVNIPFGTYSVSVSDAYGCPGNLSVTLTQPNAPLQVTYLSTQTSCNGYSDGGINISITGGETPYTIFWSNGQTTEDLSNIPAGNYTVTVVDNSGTYGGPFNWTYNTTSDNHTILIQSNTINISGYQIVAGDYIGVFYTDNNNALQCGGYFMYNDATDVITAWGDDSTTPQKDGFATGEVFKFKMKRGVDGYLVDLQSVFAPMGFNDSTYISNGISGIASLTGTAPIPILPEIVTLNITVNQPAAVVCNASNNTATCLGTPVTISVSGTGTTYLWSNGNTNSSQSVNPTVTTTYFVTATDANGCFSTDSVIVTVNPLPTINLGADITNVGSYTINAGTYTTYLWSTGATTQSISVNVTGTYSVVVTNQFTCQATDAIVVTIKAPIKFIVDDSQDQHFSMWYIKGSWNTASGVYDAAWNGGNEHSQFYDDGTHGDATAGDHIFTVLLDLVSDNGVNNWEWGVNDNNHNWIDGNFPFTVPDGDAQTLTYTHVNAIDDVNGNSNISIYPNPNNGQFTLSIENKVVDDLSVEIFSIDGKLMMQKSLLHVSSTTEEFDAHSFSKGIYYVKVSSENRTSVAKLVIE